MKVICNMAGQYKKCLAGCQHNFPHKEIIIFDNASCKSLGPCGVSPLDNLVEEVQCIPVKEEK